MWIVHKRVHGTQKGTTASTQKGTKSSTQKGTYKRKKENLQKKYSDVPSQDIVSVIDSFKEVNANYTNFFKNTTQRQASSDLIKQHGTEQVLKVVTFLPKIIGQPYAPKITTPLQLRDRYAELQAFVIQEKNKIIGKKPIVLI